MVIGFSELVQKLEDFVNHDTVHWAFSNPLATALLIVGIMMVVLFLYVDELNERQYMYMIFYMYVGSVIVFYLQNKVLLAPNSKKDSRNSAFFAPNPLVSGKNEMSFLPPEDSNWIGPVTPAIEASPPVAPSAPSLTIP